MAFDTWHDGAWGGEEESGGAWDASAGAASADVEGVPEVREGRAARRRQLARWKKNKRRAAVATAVALVGGGLTLTAMDRHSPDQARAATAPDEQSMGGVEEQTPTQARPAPVSPTPHRPSGTSEAGSPALDAPGQQTLATSPHSTPPIARPDAAAPPVPATTSVPQPNNTASPTGDNDHDPTGTAAEQPSAPAPTESTGSGNSQTGSGSAPASTSPTELCLLVLCIG
ncbi:hypothetical protein [Streptomyces aquilus]|uniref:SCO2400 family protein n=1 Tax=Streptomyces aquilus TaxID=2548456 RepID=UPI0036B875EE